MLKILETAQEGARLDIPELNVIHARRVDMALDVEIVVLLDV